MIATCSFCYLLFIRLEHIVRVCKHRSQKATSYVFTHTTLTVYLEIINTQLLAKYVSYNNL